MSAPKPFKTCAMCNHVWEQPEDLILDPSLDLRGYQAVYDEPELGLFLMLHRHPDCGTTIAVRAGLLKEFFHGEIPATRNMGRPTCPRHCLDIWNLRPCSAECDMGWVRDILQHLLHHELPEHPRSLAGD